VSRKPPKKIKIGPHIWTVRRSRSNGLSDAGASGCCDTRTQEIDLDRDLHPEAERAVLLHEIVHVLNDEFGVAAELDDETEERITSRYGTLLFMLIRENPELIDYLMED
jgi:hypothetical protein